MYVDCFDPEDEMKPSVLVGRLQLIIVDELEVTSPFLYLFLIFNGFSI